jgi:hypothetical protein
MNTYTVRRSRFPQDERHPVQSIVRPPHRDYTLPRHTHSSENSSQSTFSSFIPINGGRDPSATLGTPSFSIPSLASTPRGYPKSERYCHVMHSRSSQHDMAHSE